MFEDRLRSFACKMHEVRPRVKMKSISNHEGSRVPKTQQQNSIAYKDATTKLTYLS